MEITMDFKSITKFQFNIKNNKAYNNVVVYLQQSILIKSSIRRQGFMFVKIILLKFYFAPAFQKITIYIYFLSPFFYF